MQNWRSTIEIPMSIDTSTRPIPPSIPEVIDVESFFSRTIRNNNNNNVDRYDAVSSQPLIIDLSDTEDDDDVRILNFVPKTTPFGKRKRNHTLEKGESSKVKDTPFICEICTDTKTTKEAFFISGCSHAYCVDCVAMYVGSKLQENVINIRCPVSGCRGLLEAEDCRSILPPEVFDRWGKASCEAVIEASEKFYCPYGDCSALMIDDGTEAVRESQCPNCRRMFCGMCKVPWHEGMKCEEFQRLNKDEKEKEGVMLMGLAKKMKWMRCPNCRIYVAKTDGCMYMKCRCGHAFCYGCGARSTSNSHYCKTCKR